MANRQNNCWTCTCYVHYKLPSGKTESWDKATRHFCQLPNGGYKVTNDSINKTYTLPPGTEISCGRQKK